MTSPDYIILNNAKKTKQLIALFLSGCKGTNSQNNHQTFNAFFLKKITEHAKISKTLKSYSQLTPLRAAKIQPIFAARKHFYLFFEKMLAFNSFVVRSPQYVTVSLFGNAKVGGFSGLNKIFVRFLSKSR